MNQGTNRVKPVAIAICLGWALAIWSGPAAAQANGEAASVAAVANDAHLIAHVMKQQFDKPQAPLEVGPVSIEGNFAVAGWVQQGQGGRALLRKDGANWSIHVCGGDGLKQASTLVMSGMSTKAAEALAHKVAAAENRLPAKRRQQFAMFKGMLKVTGEHHGHHAPQ